MGSIDKLPLSDRGMGAGFFDSTSVELRFARFLSQFRRFMLRVRLSGSVLYSFSVAPSIPNCKSFLAFLIYI